MTSTLPCPSPLEAPIRSEEDVEKHRNLYCRLYDRCLDVSVAEGWASWSCGQCALFHFIEDAPHPRDFATRRSNEAVGP